MATTITNDIENEVVNITKDLNEDPTVNCEYCSSFKHPGMPCLATFENNVCFVSSRSASSSVVDNKKIKHISMRCLRYVGSNFLLKSTIYAKCLVLHIISTIAYAYVIYNIVPIPICHHILILYVPHVLTTYFTQTLTDTLNTYLHNCPFY